MRTIKLPREVKQMLEDEFDTTLNQAIKEMLQVTYMPSAEISGGRISVDVDDIVAERLDELKMYSTESVGSVVLRLLLNYQR